MANTKSQQDLVPVISSTEFIPIDRDPGCRRKILTDEDRLYMIEQGPFQPKLARYPRNRDIPPPKHCQFSSEWFNTYPHLEYSISKDAAFCFVCQLFPPLPGSDDNKTKAKAENLLARVRSFQFIVMIMFMKSVMIKTKILTKQVQSVNTNIVDTLESAKVTISTLCHLRDDEQNLNNLITAVVKFSECHGVDANGEYQRQHRHRRPTRRVDKRPETAMNLTLEGFYRKEFIQVLDLQTEALTDNVEAACDIPAPAINLLLPPFRNDL